MLQRSLGPGYSRELLEADLAAHRQGSDFAVLGRLAGQLDVLGKEQLLRGLADLELAITDGREPDWAPARRRGRRARGDADPPARHRAPGEDPVAGVTVQDRSVRGQQPVSR